MIMDKPWTELATSLRLDPHVALKIFLLRSKHLQVSLCTLVHFTSKTKDLTNWPRPWAVVRLSPLLSF